MLVEQIDLGVGDGAANGDAGVIVSGFAGPSRDIHGRFRRPVQIVQFRPVQAREETLLQLARERLAAANNTPQAGARFNSCFV